MILLTVLKKFLPPLHNLNLKGFNLKHIPSFDLLGKSGKARRGVLNLSHGKVETPAFMPVGTQASVKTVRNSDLLKDNWQIILGNTYHLYLRPGVEVIANAGGLHKFMSWNRNILTDSGGFQLFSLSKLRKRSEEGYHFQSHIDGSSHLLTPEKVIELQTVFGSDIMMVLDECLEQPSDRVQTEESLSLTLRWAEKARKVHTGGQQALFGIVQGGGFQDLRRKSAEALSQMEFDGYAIGGVAVGESRNMMMKAVKSCIDYLPEDRPRYLMGVGKPEDLVDFVALGVDMFDCVVPTRNARGGAFFVPGGHINIRNARFRNDPAPIQPGCQCYTCTTYSRSYLRHLFAAKEWLAPILATLHNLHYFSVLMGRIRMAVEEHHYTSWRKEWHRKQRNFDKGVY
ncbi:MAG: tRNA guanosine(34) transglycosylase Tgt [Candidatus Aegiribacteria sp.]|nr:tRNA guanosine(34) transglycosylase Tgt [Candidatus Aegiribacteria sp.]